MSSRQNPFNHYVPDFPEGGTFHVLNQLEAVDGTLITTSGAITAYAYDLDDQAEPDTDILNAYDASGGGTAAVGAAATSEWGGLDDVGYTFRAVVDTSATGAYSALSDGTHRYKIEFKIATSAGELWIFVWLNMTEVLAA